MNSKARLELVTLITLVRFPLVLGFFVLAMAHAELERIWLFGSAFVCLILSEVTDVFDGYLARKLGVVTKFGSHVDPLMDKFVYLTTMPLLVFIAASNGHRLHATCLLVLTLLFLSRDQWVTFLRSIGSMYDLEVAANWAGKLRTCVNFPLICAIYFFEGRRKVPGLALYLLEALALIVNTLSVCVYTRRYWPHLRVLARGDNPGGQTG